MKKTVSIKGMVFTALFAAVLCAVSPFSIPIGPVPLSLATLVIYIAAASLDWKYGTMSVIVYIVIGLVGVPVFSNFGAGVTRLVGPTGGFLIGYIAMAFVVGLLVGRLEAKRWAYPAAMVLGTIVLYIFGAAWFMVLMNATLAKALAMCVIPFLPGDAAKIILASVLAPILRRALKRQRG